MLPCLRAGMYRLAACVLNITSRMLVLNCADSYKKSGMPPPYPCGRPGALPGIMMTSVDVCPANKGDWESPLLGDPPSIPSRERTKGWVRIKCRCSDNY